MAANDAQAVPRAARPAWSANSSGDRLFVDMLHAFRATGGLAREAEVASRWRARHAEGQADWLAAARRAQVIRFDWGGVAWLPMFQFHGEDLSPHPVARQVADELQSLFDGWGLANWFAQPNTWLGGERPVDLLASQPARLLEAARVDRFIMGG